MAIKHEDVKTSMDKGYASEWNKNHIIDGDVDFNKHQADNLVIENRTTFPAGPVEGQVIFRTDLNRFYIWNGTAWDTFVSPATIVIAADGSGNYTNIQDGIDALPATGGVVYVKEGTYTITAELDVNKPNVAIIGAGRATIIQVVGDVNGIVTSLADSADGCKFEKLRIIGTDEATQIGIKINTDKCLVSDCWIEDFYQGIVTEDANDTIINMNIVSSCDNMGIWVLAAVAQARNIVSSNSIDNCGTGIVVTQGTDIIINGNLVRNSGAVGIAIETNCSEIVVVGNLCVDNGQDGVRIITNVDNCAITGNVLANNTQWGMRIWNATCDKNVVVGNVLTGNGLGGLSDAGTGTVSGNNSS